MTSLRPTASPSAADATYAPNGLRALVVLGVPCKRLTPSHWFGAVGNIAVGVWFTGEAWCVAVMDARTIHGRIEVLGQGTDADLDVAAAIADWRVVSQGMRRAA